MNLELFHNHGSTFLVLILPCYTTEFQTSPDALNAAQNEECNAVEVDRQSGPLEDEQDFLIFCYMASLSQTTKQDDSLKL